MFLDAVCLVVSSPTTPARLGPIRPPEAARPVHLGMGGNSNAFYATARCEGLGWCTNALRIVTYLLGPGQAQGAYQLFWDGAKARAVYAEKAMGFGREGRLDVLSKTMEAALAAKQQAQLKAENAQ